MMEDVELVEKLLGELGKVKNTSKNKDIAKNLLNDITDSRMTGLKEAIVEITEQIKYREELHNEMMSDIESLKSTINNMTPSANADNGKVIMEFQKKLIESEEMKANEKLNCFRDVAQLKKELREFIREFRDKESRASLLGELLADAEE